MATLTNVGSSCFSCWNNSETFGLRSMCCTLRLPWGGHGLLKPVAALDRVGAHCQHLMTPSAASSELAVAMTLFY
jgi:hypothetical protein